MHFAPQWVKPIKPTGTSAASPNTAEISPSALNPHPSKTPTQHAQVPFPALSSGTLGSPISATHPGNNNAPMSYSRATHTPVSPGFPTDGSYFPSPDTNGASLNPYPFRYSKEQILALFDEEKVKGTPIELVDLREKGSVLVAPHANRPIGLRELTEAEKKASGNLDLVLNSAYMPRSSLLPFTPLCPGGLNRLRLHPRLIREPMVRPLDEQVPRASLEIPLNRTAEALEDLVEAKEVLWLPVSSSQVSLEAESSHPQVKANRQASSEADSGESGNDSSGPGWMVQIPHHVSYVSCRPTQS